MLISVIIPSRSPQYLQRTIDDLLAKAEGDLEIICVLDGIWPDPIVKDDKRVIILHQGTQHNSLGMRAAINAGVAISKGNFLMKTDEHCSFSQGYDIALAKDCLDNEVIIPRRGRLDAEKWEKIEDGRSDIDYMAVEYPYLKPYDETQGLHGKIWNRPGREHILKDETPTMQGSCYFMSRKHWDKVIKKMNEEAYGFFTMEAQEISCATWLSGGRVMVNKKVTYCHYHKGHAGKGYGFSRAQYVKHAESKEKGRLYAINYFLYTKDFKYDWDWFINEKFPDMPGWSKTWREDLEKDKHKDYSTLGYKDNKWLEGLRK